MLTKANAYAKLCKKSFAENDLAKAGHWWCRIFALNLSAIELSNIMSKFTDKEVFEITDYLRNRYYRAVGII
jgi:hypothetical protein